MLHMPQSKKDYKKKTPKEGKKKRMYKRSIIPTAPANHTLVKLRYSENILMTSTAGAVQSYIYRINDLYDPNYSGTGHQAYFRDQLFAMYQYGRVLWASIKITVITDGATTPCYIVLGPAQSGSADTDMATASERKGSKEAYINANQVGTLKVASSVDYYFGQKKGAALADTAYVQNASSSLNTGDLMWYQILVRSMNGSTQNFYVKVDIEQITRFESPLQQSGS